MAGLLAWAADVVGGSGQSADEEERPLAVVFTAEQQQQALDLDRRTAELRRSIQELRLRIPPAHIAQRLPHLHAHSLASNAALALQLNAHSTTREQAQIREITLQEENAAYEKAIENCQKKIQEKLDEAALLQQKLKEMDMIERNLKAEMDKAVAAVEYSQSAVSSDDSKSPKNFPLKGKHLENVKSEELEHKKKDLEDKKKELSSIEESVKILEEKWSLVQQESARQPSPAQREKLLEKQLHDLIEQLTAKQEQAEGLINEIHAKEKELERLNELRTGLEAGNTDANTTRNRFGKSYVGTYADYYAETPRRFYHTAARTENHSRLMLLRSAFVLYILALHVVVFIKISF